MPTANDKKGLVWLEAMNKERSLVWPSILCRPQGSSYLCLVPDCHHHRENQLLISSTPYPPYPRWLPASLTTRRLANPFIMEPEGNPVKILPFLAKGGQGCDTWSFWHFNLIAAGWGIEAGAMQGYIRQCQRVELPTGVTCPLLIRNYEPPCLFNCWVATCLVYGVVSS